MALPPTPYNTLFRGMVSDRRRAAALLKDYLPAKLARAIDWTELRRFGYWLHDLPRTARAPLSRDREVDFGLEALRFAFVRSLSAADLDRLTRGLPQDGDSAGR